MRFEWRIGQRQVGESFLRRDFGLRTSGDTRAQLVVLQGQQARVDVVELELVRPDPLAAEELGRQGIQSILWCVVEDALADNESVIEMQRDGPSVAVARALQ